MKVYCQMQGVIRELTNEEKKDFYKTQCLARAENCLDGAQDFIKLAVKYLELSHKYDRT